MSNDEPDKECPTCHNRFFLYSLKGVKGDLTISIPAEDEQQALSVLDDVVQKPDEWVREKELEKQLGGMVPKTGRRKPVKPWFPPTDASGPMYG